MEGPALFEGGKDAGPGAGGEGRVDEDEVVVGAEGVYEAADLDAED